MARSPSYQHSPLPVPATSSTTRRGAKPPRNTTSDAQATGTSRRGFLMVTAATATSLLLAQHVGADDQPARKKSQIGTPDTATLEKLQAAGFDGIESSVWDAPLEVARQQRKGAEELGMRIHSVLRGWTNFNSPDSVQVDSDIASVKTALQTSQVYGADAVLLVPCRLLAEVAVPRPEDFEIEIEDRTGHVRQVVRGDNSQYAPYIKAQNEAIDASRKALEQLIPVAERTGVVIALENVWSNLWVKPNLFAHFVRSFDSPWIRSYFDIGNHVKYAAPEQWIQALGKTIVKIHVKDFVVDRASPQGGQFVDICEGDVRWPAVMRELDKIEYYGWMTIEGSGGLSLEQQSERLDQILASS